MSPSPPKVETIECIASSKPHTPALPKAIQFVVEFSSSSDLPEGTKDDATEDHVCGNGETATSKLGTSASDIVVPSPQPPAVQETESDSVVDPRAKSGTSHKEQESQSTDIVQTAPLVTQSARPLSIQNLDDGTPCLLQTRQL